MVMLFENNGYGVGELQLWCSRVRVMVSEVGKRHILNLVEDAV
jgi:hypothetical protein